MKGKHIIWRSLVFCLVFGFTSQGSSIAQTTKPQSGVAWDQVVDAAKKEGKVMIYGRATPEMRAALDKSFIPKYGIAVELLNIPQGSQMTAKLKAERQAGLCLADLIIHGPTTTTLLKSEGILDPVEPLLILPEVTDPGVWKKGFFFMDKERMLKPMRARFVRFVVRNTGMVNKGELNSYRDLLNPKWKGKMVMDNLTLPGTGNTFLSFLVAIWGRDQTVTFMKELAAQEPVITTDIRLGVEWVARGKYPIGIGLRATELSEFFKVGAPIETVKTIEGGQMGPGDGTIAVVNKRPHPNATALFVNWILTKEGQAAWYEGDGLPSARLDVSTEGIDPIFLPETDENVSVEDEACQAVKGEMGALAKEIFAPLLK
jgi:iron(III) transport system substrate-binding protein